MGNYQKRCFFGFLFIFFGAGLLLAQDPIRPMFETALTHFHEGDYETAEIYCKGVVDLNPLFFPVYNLMGMIYSHQEGAERRAIEVYEKSLNLNSRQPDIYNNIASVYYRLDDADNAVFYMREGLKHDPDNFNLIFNLGIIYLFGKNDIYSAIDFLNRAQKIDSHNERLIYLNGVAHLLIGRQEVSLGHVTRLRELKKEKLAAGLENAIREYGVNRDVNMEEVVRTYTAPSEEEDKSAGSGSISAGDASVQIKGSGTITIEHRYDKR